MLILSRQKQQSIVCTLPDGREVVFTILECKGKWVRVGIAAPDDVRIGRREGDPPVTSEPKEVR